ncbi:MAG: rubrerythrin [Candidatus Kariarchaeaceae archaeon]
MIKTLTNVLQAYVGESQARNRYDFYGKVAKKEGYEQIAGLFFEISVQEKTHGKNFLRMYKKLQKELGITEDEVVLEEVHVGTVYGTTIENLKAAIAGEHHENTTLYPEFARIAEEEGYPEMAAQIRAISTAEEHHEEVFIALLEQIEAGTVFKKDEKIWWLCRECGYIHFGKEPPLICPSCDHPQAYFQRKCEDF